jgi:hypothetical protein
MVNPEMDAGQLFHILPCPAEKKWGRKKTHPALQK